MLPHLKDLHLLKYPISFLLMLLTDLTSPQNHTLGWALLLRGNTSTQQPLAALFKKEQEGTARLEEEEE